MSAFDPPVEYTMEHFDEPLRPGKYGHRLVRERCAIIKKLSSFYPDRRNYSDKLWAAVSWRYEDENHRILSDKYYDLLRKDALENFDLNMAFFKQLDPADFEQALEKTLAKHKKLPPVTDLRTLNGVEGVYVMVLDQIPPGLRWPRPGYAQTHPWPLVRNQIVRPLRLRHHQ